MASSVSCRTGSPGTIGYPPSGTAIAATDDAVPEAWAQPSGSTVSVARQQYHAATDRYGR
jgi:hypothetical protein